MSEMTLWRVRDRLREKHAVYFPLWSEYGEMADVIDAHMAKAAEDARDAARYRWLRSRPVTVPMNGPDLATWSDYEDESIRGDKADAEIDAAMAGEVKSNG